MNRRDPTGSQWIIKAYERDILKRIKQFRAGVIEALPMASPIIRAQAGEAAGALDTEGMARAIQDLALRLIINPLRGTVKGRVVQSYRQGAAFADRQAAGVLGVKPVLGGPEDWRVIDALMVRNLGVLKGLTEEMQKNIILELVKGRLHGEGPALMATRIRDVVGIGLTRARVIARTEVMTAINQGAKIRYSQMGVEDVIWMSAPMEEGKVCEECAALDGKRFALDEAPEIPVHPNCRCALRPAMSTEVEEEENG